MDLIGTCYDLLHKPYPITQRHVDMLRHRVIMGTHKGPSITPDLDTFKDTKKSMKKPGASDIQQSTIEEGVELNEESIHSVIK